MNDEKKSQTAMPEDSPVLLPPQGGRRFRKPEDQATEPQQKETIKNLALRFGGTLLASMILGLASAALTGWVMVQLLDNRVTILETKVKEQSPLTVKVDKLETTIERHEKALDRDFLRHEQVVANLANKTEDQERRLTLLEAHFGETQALIVEIRADIKTLLTGNTRH